MALTLRPTEDEIKLIDDIKIITNEKSSTKAIMKSMVALKVSLRELEETKAELHRMTIKANSATTVVRSYRTALDQLEKLEL